MIGGVSLILAVGAAVAWSNGDQGLAGILGRTAAVMASIWLAFPALVAVDRRTIWLVGLAIVVVLIRPRSALVVLGVVAIFTRTTKVRRGSADG